MKIFFVNPYFPPYAPGGAEYSLKILCEKLASKGFQVRVFTNCFDGSPGIKEKDGYEVEYLDCPVSFSPGQDIDASKYIFSMQYQKKVFTALQKYSVVGEKPDVLIANNAPSFISVANAGVSLRIPTIGIVRDTQVVCETGSCIDCQSAQNANPCKGLLGSAICMVRFQRNRGYKHLRSIPGIVLNGLKVGLHRQKITLQGTYRLDYLVAISNALQSLLIKGPCVAEGNIKTIGNFSTQVIPATSEQVESYLAEYNLKPKCFFLVAGKKSYGKGSDIAARAIQLVAKERPDIKLLFVGKGHVSEKQNDFFVDNPSVSQELLMGLLQNSLTLLIPGRWQEGLHRTMIDATRYGIPVICTEAGGPSENIIHNYSGYVVPCDSAQDLSFAMQSRLEWDAERLLLCRKKAQKIFDSKFSDRILLTQWENLLQSISVK